MVERVHDKLLSGHNSPHAFPLADELTNQIQEQVANSRVREGAFVVPEHRLALDGATEVVAITGNRRVNYEDVERNYRDFQVDVLNTLLAAKDPISASTLGEMLKFRLKQQYDAVRDLAPKTGTSKHSQFMLRHTIDGEDFFSINPNVGFIDLRPAPDERLATIENMCRRFSGDPAVQRQLEQYCVQTVDYLPDYWDAEKIADHQQRDFKPLGKEHEAELMQFFQDVVDRCMSGDASEDEQREAVVAYNKLVYSCLSFSNYMVLESAGIIRKAGWNPLSGFIKRYANDNLSRPLADAKQFGAVGVIKAIQSFDPSRGEISTHIIRCVDAEVRRGFINLTRHAFGFTRHEADGSEPAPATNRRYFSQDNAEREDYAGSMGFVPPEYEEIVADVGIMKLVHATLNDAKLRLSDQLILSLSTGIYILSLEGRELRGANGKKFIYDENLKSNEVFRDGMTDKDLGDMFGIKPLTVAKLRRKVFQRFEDALRVRLSTCYYNEKWHDVQDWLR